MSLEEMSKLSKVLPSIMRLTSNPISISPVTSLFGDITESNPKERDILSS